MSKKIRHSVEISAPPDRAWAAFADLSTWPRWFPTLSKVDLGTSALAVGDEMVLHLSFRGHAAPVKVRIEESSGHRVRWVGRSFGVTGDHAFFVEPIDAARCRFVSEEQFRGFPVRLIPRFIFDELERATADGLERFRRLVET